MVYVLGVTCAALGAIVLLLFARIGAVEARMRRLEQRFEPGPYRAPSPLAETSASLEEVSRDPVILQELREGNLIAAIKRHREITGCGLKESKEAVEAMRDRLRRWRDGCEVH